MLPDKTILIFWILVNLIAIGMALLAWKRPNWGRFLFAFNFLGAAIFNTYFLITDASEFIYYADFTFLKFYRNFIIHLFTEHLTLFMGIIVVSQFLIGLALLGRGWVLKTGAIGGILFLVAIAPLGLGAAFPATLILAFGLFIFIWRNQRKTG